MTEVTKHLTDLTPAQRAALFQQLQQRRLHEAPPRQQIERQPRTTNRFALSFAQQRLWFLDQFEPNNPQYNIPQAFRIRGVLDGEVLERVLHEIVRRHEALRTTFDTENGRAVQVISARAPLVMHSIDLRDQPDFEREAVAREIMGEDARQPFELARGPFLRVRLMQLDDGDHILYFNMHHIVSDVWSYAVLFRELTILYRAFIQGQPSPLPDLPVQYVDFSLWQRAILQGDVLNQQIDYWKDQLVNTPPLELPTDRPRPPVRTYRGTIESVRLPASLTPALHALSRQENVTLFMTLLAGFQTLLYRYTGQPDFAVGTLIANRQQPELEGLIGFFANTLVLRANLAGNPTFRELLAQAREVALGAYAHQDLPFERLIDELKLPRDLSRSPLFQVMLLLHNAPITASELPGLTFSPMAADSQTAKFDLTLYLAELPDGLQADLEYNSDLFDRATILRLMGHYEQLLAGAVTDPDQRILDLPLLTATERQQLLVEWNATGKDYPRHACLHELVEAQVQRTPQRVAVGFEGATLSYAALDAQANQMAHVLQGLGIGPEQLVGICLDRSLSMVVAVLGVLKAGGAYVPLDPGYPAARLAMMLEDGRPRVIVTQARYRDLVAGYGAVVICIDSDEAQLAAAPAHKPGVAVTGANRAYVIFTSGSTGRPKGVQIPHQAVVNFVLSMARRPGLDADDTLLAVTTLSFDIAGLELYLPLIVGGRLEVASRDTASFGEQLLTALTGSGITAMQATPATWRLLLGAGWRGDRRMKILCGGEALPADLLAELLARSGAVWNMYGPTETTIWSTTARLLSAEGPVSIGRPIANTQVYVLDQAGQPVPVGVTGELYLAGAGLSWGYLGQPGMTATRFVPDPFSPVGGARMYHTGDVARYLADGRLEYLGRVDQQVKVRGFRIELGEIEAALAQVTGVRQAVAVAQEESPGNKRLVAYLVAEPGTDTSAATLRAFLKTRLPDYMIPAIFVTLEKMPLTPNGKVDRRHLPAPDTSRLAQREAYVAPRNPVEQTLAGIWARLLNVQQVGIHDNFFTLGGDSLLVIRVVGQAADAGLTLTTKQVFQHQTIAELAAVVGTVRIHADQGPVTGPVPLTFSMYQFFGYRHLIPNYYSLSFFLEIPDGIDAALMRQVIEHLVCRHDSLRIRLVGDSDSPSAVIDPPDDRVPFTTIDLTTLTAEEQDACMRQATSDAEQSFDMWAGRLFNAVHFDLGKGQPGYLLLAGHYLVADVLSWQLLGSDLDLAYQQLERGDPIKLPAKSTSVQYWGQRLNEFAQTPGARDVLPYWLGQFARPLVALPLDHPAGANTVASSCNAATWFSIEETQAIQQVLLKAFDVKLDALLLTGILHAFAEWTGVPRMSLDLYVIGRDPLFEEVDVSRTVGWFTFCFPITLDIEQAGTLVEALYSVKQQLASIPQGGISYGALRYYSEDSAVRDALAALPKPEVFFNFFGVAPPNRATYRTRRSASGHHHDRDAVRRRKLAIAGALGQGRLWLDWEYSDTLHRPETIEGVAERCGQVVRELLALAQLR